MSDSVTVSGRRDAVLAGAAVVVVVMVVCEVANVSGVIGSRGPLSLFRISLLLGMMSLGLALRDPVARGRLNRWTFGFIGLVGIFLLTRLLSSLGAQDVIASVGLLTNEVADFLFIVVVLMLVQVTERWWAVAAAVVVPLAILSVLTLVNQLFFGGAASFGGFATVTQASGELVTTPRYGGPLPDSNFWGRHLIMGLPLAGALIVRARAAEQRRAMLAWAAAMLALLIGIYLTQSRGTFIATLVVLIVWTVASGAAARRRAVKMLPIVLLALLVPGVGNRLIALFNDLWGSQPGYTIDPSVAGRMAAQEVAWAMFHDRPMFGFGLGGFGLEVPRYSGLVPTAVVDPATAAPHDLYAELACEGGVVGLIGWAILVGGVVACIAIRVSQLALRSEVVERCLAAAVLAAIIGWSTASIFIHLSYLRTFGIMLALGGAMAANVGPHYREAMRAWPRTIGAAAAAAALGVVVLAAFLTASATPIHTASQRVTLLPNPETDYGYAYALDVRSRNVVLPSYAAMMVADSTQAAATADTVRGIVTITVTASDHAAARDQLDRALERARGNLARFGADSLYELRTVGAAVQRDGHEHSAAAAGVALGAGTIVAVGAFLLLQRQARSRRRMPDESSTRSQRRHA